jgi:hypothetical protein
MPGGVAVIRRWLSLPTDAGVGHHDVDSAQLTRHLLHRRVDAGGVGDINHRSVCLPSVLLQRRHCGLQRVLG